MEEALSIAVKQMLNGTINRWIMIKIPDDDFPLIYKAPTHIELHEKFGSRDLNPQAFLTMSLDRLAEIQFDIADKIRNYIDTA